ncbi:uncharacterized protein BP5553_10060 [Venustampulla echinocandica]|uniref:DNA-directed RNA polymerase n=1 Tax=Venustampulla echinocandica TaxID=2656787 RepID=A0A370TA89_9HELO|nr:uncharacterized protein BP5553_10060 [Venustampulla echinocandica]RDL30715.1 hypothetical protein BP5553_10060 [Venustampulla echinocandica]
MLARAARRKIHPRAIRTQAQASLEQLCLPWLCPVRNAITIPAYRQRQRWISTDAASQKPELRRRRNSSSAAAAPPRRTMATAVDNMPLDDIPFEGLGIYRQPSSHSYIGINGLSNLGYTNHLDPYENGLANSEQRIRANKSGISGDISEVLSVYYACLQVGRLERAAVILRRVLQKVEADTDEIVALHNQYLRASVEQIMLSPSESARQSIHKWFELEIRLKGIPHNAEMVAYMLKASLQSPDDATGGNRNRLVHRYMGMVEGQAGLDVLGLNILTAGELNQINHICPKYNLAEGFEEDFEDDFVDSGHVSPEPSGKEALLPGVRPTGQKGLGLKALKKALSLFSAKPGEGLGMASKSPEERRQVQEQLEEDAVGSAVERWREEDAAMKKMGMDSAMQSKSIGARMWNWQLGLEKYLEEEIARVEIAEAGEVLNDADEERCLYGPFLRILPTDKLAAVTILTTMSQLGMAGADRGLVLSRIILKLAGAAEDESVFEAIQQNIKKGVWSKKAVERLDIENLKKLSRNRGGGFASTVVNEVWMGKGKQDEEKMTPFVWKQWPLAIKAKVGAFLMSALIEVAMFPVEVQHAVTHRPMSQLQPAFAHAFQYRMGKKFGVVVASKAMVEGLKREPVHSLLAKHLPMVVEPEPWTLFNKGGFLVHPGKLMRVKQGDSDQRFYAEAAIGQGDMVELCEGLDVLGKTEWRINQPVFEVMLEAWNSGEAIGNISPENPKLEIPPEPEASSDPLIRRRWMRAVKAIENQRTGLHSQRCFQNFQLEIARALRTESFYFPHNIDFRGRAYPIPPYLNHMGADHCRGLLRFGKGRELGESGLRWLKVHLSNVFGFDKASLKDREDFADDHMGDIYDSALNPLNGKRWWLKAEDPWQCLAVCIELRNAVESPDPTRFISHLPVHQDGTCNGLQHYAALGGDIWGAKQVNLEPGDRPADVYTAVADMVMEGVARDKLKGDPFALVLDGKITRKTVKQTVMTNVYGVTFIGARDQVKKQLVAAYPDLPNGTVVNPLSLSSYIAKNIFTALGNMFRGAHDIQYWFGECASRISTSLTQLEMDRICHEWPGLSDPDAKSRGKSLNKIDDWAQFKSTVIWTTPLNMPVVQPYRSSKSKTVSTNMQNVSLSQPHRTHPVSKRKQLQGFPPNFIHSLDATHMLLSALKCDEIGLSFAAVHDSFWTHAADIEKMNTILRDSFIKIHSEDVIGRLAAEFNARYKGSMYLAHVRKNSPVGEKIFKWRKERAKLDRATSIRAGKTKLPKAPKLSELVLELKRQKLINSSDPNEVEEGKNMTTPTTIFAELSAEADLAPEPELDEVAIGRITGEPSQRATASDGEVTDPVIDEEQSDLSSGTTQTDVALDEDNEDVGRTSEAPEDPLSTFEKHLAKGGGARSIQIPVWLPLTFPPVPKKGEFDVSRLKDSQYFFS